HAHDVGDHGAGASNARAEVARALRSAFAASAAAGVREERLARDRCCCGAREVDVTDAATRPLPVPHGAIPSLDGIRAIAVALVFLAHNELEAVIPGG